MDGALDLYARLPVQASDAGLFVSRERGTHPTRVMPVFDLIFVREGELRISESGQAFIVRSGQTLLLWPQRLHGGSAPYGPELSFYWVHFTTQTAPALPDTAEFGMGLTVPQYATVSRPDALAALFDRYLDDQEAGCLPPISASLLLMQMLTEISDLRPPAPQDDSPTNVLAVRAGAFIRTHYHLRLSASVLADELNCNPDYLGRIFRKVYGHTLTEAIHEHRLSKARRLLLGSDRNIDEIARECGFEDPGYFRRLFKRAQGMTTLAYRRRYARVYVNTE